LSAGTNRQNETMRRGDERQAPEITRRRCPRPYPAGAPGRHAAWRDAAPPAGDGAVKGASFDAMIPSIPRIGEPSPACGFATTKPDCKDIAAEPDPEVRLLRSRWKHTNEHGKEIVGKSRQHAEQTLGMIDAAIACLSRLAGDPVRVETVDNLDLG
jgi:hypothetical protein